MNMLHIDSQKVVECMKWWDGLQIRLPQVIITGEKLNVVEDGKQLYANQSGDGKMNLEVMELLRSIKYE